MRKQRRPQLCLYICQGGADQTRPELGPGSDPDAGYVLRRVGHTF